MTEQEQSFGHWLRRRRKARDLTQAELAARAEWVVTTIKKIETGARRPSRQLAGRLAAALALTPEEPAALLAAVSTDSSPSLPLYTPFPTSFPLPSLSAAEGLLERRPSHRSWLPHPGSESS